MIAELGIAAKVIAETRNVDERRGSR